jgi:hypothetical protein
MAKKTKAPKPKRTHQQMGKRSREKGVKYEQWVARQLAVVYPTAKRGIGQARRADEVPDVEGTPWWVETKHNRCAKIQTAYKQAVTARAKSPSVYRRAPILVVTRDDGSEDLATLPFAELVKMMRELEALRRSFDGAMGA